MTTRNDVKNKKLERRARPRSSWGRSGKSYQAKGVADQVESDLKNAGEDLKNVART